MRFRVLLLSEDGDPVVGYWALDASELPDIGAVIHVTNTRDGDRMVRARVGQIAVEQSLPIVAKQTDE